MKPNDNIRAGPPVEPGSVDSSFQSGRDKEEPPVNNELGKTAADGAKFTGAILLFASLVSGFLITRGLDVIIAKHTHYLQLHVNAHGENFVYAGPAGPQIPVETNWSRLRAQMFGIPWVIAFSCATASILLVIFPSALPRNQRRLVWTTGLGAISGILYAFLILGQSGSDFLVPISPEAADRLQRYSIGDENRPIVSGDPSQLGNDPFLVAYCPLIGIVVGYALCLVLEIRESQATNLKRITSGQEPK